MLLWKHIPKQLVIHGFSCGPPYSVMVILKLEFGAEQTLVRDKRAVGESWGQQLKDACCVQYCVALFIILQFPAGGVDFTSPLTLGLVMRSALTNKG